MACNMDFPALVGAIGMFVPLRHGVVFANKGLRDRDRERVITHSNESHGDVPKTHLSSRSCIMAWSCPIFSCNNRKQKGGLLRRHCGDRKRKANTNSSSSIKKKKNAHGTVTSKWGPSYCEKKRISAT